MSRPLRAILNLNALRHNYQLTKQWMPHRQLLPVLKANGYGHGAVLTAQALAFDAKAFGVACIEEALQLRNAGIKQPILLMEGFFNVDELKIIAELNFWVCLHSHWQVDALIKAPLSRPVSVWLKFDSGMHRLGFNSIEFIQQWQRLQASSNVNNLVLMSHFATADEENKYHVNKQLYRIKKLIAQLPYQQKLVTSLSNSAALINLTTVADDWVRPGILLYGINPVTFDPVVSKQLQPMMTLQSEIIAINEIDANQVVGYGAHFITQRPTRLAVVACGYADGYDRHAKAGTPVLIEGQRAPIIGRVAMDMLTIDVTDIPHAHIGSQVTLWGYAANGQCLDINEVAKACDTISYTLLTNLNARVARTIIPLIETNY